MSMKLRYINSDGVEMPLNGHPYYIDDESIFDYSWDVNTIERGKIGSIVDYFGKKGVSINTTLYLHNLLDDEFNAAMNDFFKTVEVDVLRKQPGKLAIEDGTYIQCFITAGNNNYWNMGRKANKKDISIFFPYPMWIKENKFNFYRQDDTPVTGDFLDYPFDYEYDYTRNNSAHYLTNDSITDANFKMVIYGPATSPSITIGDRVYHVNTTVNIGEYLVIDAITKKITLVQNDRTVINKFNDRDREHYVFEKIPSGNHFVTWNGSFSFDVTVFDERSEPRWT